MEVTAAWPVIPSPVPSSQAHWTARPVSAGRALTPAETNAQWLSPHLLLGALPGMGRSEGLKKHKSQGPEPGRAEHLPSPSTKCSQVQPQNHTCSIPPIPTVCSLSPKCRDMQRVGVTQELSVRPWDIQLWAVPSEEHPGVSPARVWSWVGFEGRSPGESGCRSLQEGEA